MRRPTNSDGIAGGGTLRLDPFALPVRFAVPPAGKPPGAAISATIDLDTVIVTRPGGQQTLPMRSYRGVAVRMAASTETGALRVVLELNHRDPALTLTIAEADDPADIVADWLAWARAVKLPMLMIDLNGVISRPSAMMGSVKILPIKPRRMHSYFASRRPRFLAKRKPGWRGGNEIVTGDELIARH